MYNRTRLIVIVAVGGIAGAATAASYYDGESTLLCTAHRLAQCDAADGCIAVKADEIGSANGQWLVDFKRKTLAPADPAINRRSKITSVHYLDGTLYAQSIEDGSASVPDGAAWSLSVSDPDGAMTLAVASNSVAFVGTGVCVPIK